MRFVQFFRGLPTTKMEREGLLVMLLPGFIERIIFVHEISASNRYNINIDICLLMLLLMVCIIFVDKSKLFFFYNSLNYYKGCGLSVSNL